MDSQRQGMLILAPEARHDLRELRDRIARHNPKAAHRVLMRLRELARGLAGTPATNRDRPAPGTALRSSVADGRVLFYRPLEGVLGIVLARVLHGAGDLDVTLSGDEG